MFETVGSAAAAASDNARAPQFVTLLGEKLLAPPDTLDGLLLQLPPVFISATSELHRRVLSARLGVPQLPAVEFYR